MSCEFFSLYCDYVWLHVVYEVYRSSIWFLIPNVHFVVCEWVAG